MLVRLPVGSLVTSLLIVSYSSCEYREGCEWREAKAREIAEKFGVIHEEELHELDGVSESDEDSEDTDYSHVHKGGVNAASMF